MRTARTLGAKAPADGHGLSPEASPVSHPPQAPTSSCPTLASEKPAFPCLSTGDPCPVLPGRKCQTGDKTPWTVPRWLGSFELCWASGNGCSLQPRRRPRAPQVVLFLLPYPYQILPGMLQANSALEVREDFKARQAGLGPLLGFAFWILNSLLRSRWGQSAWLVGPSNGARRGTLS